MISERELRQVAGRLGLGVGQAEHEYVMLCALDALTHTPPLSGNLCLKGGTALRLGYFEDWRHSVDLDFTVLPDVSKELLRAELSIWFENVETIHDVKMTLRDYHTANGAIRMRARFEGPLRHPSRLLFDLTLDEPVLLTPEQRPVVINHFPDLRPQVLMYQLQEILAEKLRSILQRGKARDYYDTWRLLREQGDAFDMPDSRRLLDKKCLHIGMKAPELSDFFQPLLLQGASVYWSQDLLGQTPEGTLPAWNMVIDDLADLIDSLLT
ncbi:MAG: nucleotidyl transferase AbiEii/AbiGii toxin family protein [Chloroflexi bacterium]|nr:nucleotidyl transferase AbiEii/AbiGii toxin family protein [Chloroflexota bacterium]